MESFGTITSSTAGFSLAQIFSSDMARSQQDLIARQRRLDAIIRADDASGIAPADGEQHAIGQRGPDGRLPWYIEAGGNRNDRKKLSFLNCSSLDYTGGQLDLMG